jgi:hypothetical protein
VKYVVTWRAGDLETVFFEPHELADALDLAVRIRRIHRGRVRVIIGGIAT